MKFELDAGERTKLEIWNKEHLAAEHEGEEPYAGAIGGRVSFILTSTGLGMIMSVECSMCKRKKLREAVFKVIYDFNKTDDGYGTCLTDMSDW